MGLTRVVVAAVPRVLHSSGGVVDALGLVSGEVEGRAHRGHRGPGEETGGHDGPADLHGSSLRAVGLPQVARVPFICLGAEVQSVPDHREAVGIRGVGARPDVPHHPGPRLGAIGAPQFAPVFRRGSGEEGGAADGDNSRGALWRCLLAMSRTSDDSHDRADADADEGAVTSNPASNAVVVAAMVAVRRRRMSGAFSREPVRPTVTRRPGLPRRKDRTRWYPPQRLSRSAAATLGRDQRRRSPGRK